MIYTTNILAVPLVIALWALDMYLFLLIAYSVLTRLSGERASQLCSCLKLFTEPLPQVVKRWLGRHTSTPVKQWVPWAVVILACLIIRHVLILVIVSLG